MSVSVSVLCVCVARGGRVDVPMAECPRPLEGGAVRHVQRRRGVLGAGAPVRRHAAYVLVLSPPRNFLLLLQRDSVLFSPPALVQSNSGRVLGTVLTTGWYLQNISLRI